MLQKSVCETLAMNNLLHIFVSKMYFLELMI